MMSPGKRKHPLRTALNLFTYEHQKPAGRLSILRQNTVEAAKTLDSLISEKASSEALKKDK